MKKKSYFTGVLIGKGLPISLVDSYLKATKGALVAMKGFRRTTYSVYMVVQLLE